MPSRQRLAVGVIVTLALALGAWVYLSPYMAFRAMKAAADRRDAATMSEYVDFPALRESMKATFNAQMAAATAKRSDGSPGAQLGAAIGQAFAGLIVNSFVDAMVSPEGLAMLMKGERPKLDNKPSAPDAAEKDIETVTEYEAFDRFVVRPGPKSAPSDETVALVLRRHGLSTWKLSAIRLPM